MRLGAPEMNEDEGEDEDEGLSSFSNVSPSAFFFTSGYIFLQFMLDGWDKLRNRPSTLRGREGKLR